LICGIGFSPILISITILKSEVIFMDDINHKNGLNVNGEDIQPLDIEDVAADFTPLSLNDQNQELLEEDLKAIMGDDIHEEASPDATIEFDNIPSNGDVDNVDMDEVSPFGFEPTEELPQNTYPPCLRPRGRQNKTIPQREPDIWNKVLENCWIFSIVWLDNGINIP
jgi:hypothetical protein